MKAKLIKNPFEHYYLIVDKVPQFAYITEPLTGGYIIASSGESELFKLSLKNCQAIERGYDLDELATNFANEELRKEYGLMGNFSSLRAIYLKGFQKALEILGDKKFSEEDIKNAIEYGIQSVLQAIPGVTSTQGILDSYKQSLQKTEWDVELEMEFVGRGKHGIGSEVNHYMPKRDVEGCLILKRS